MDKDTQKAVVDFLATIQDQLVDLAEDVREKTTELVKSIQAFRNLVKLEQ